MIPWRSIEFRLTAWYCLMLFVGHLIFSAALWLTVSSAIRIGVDDLLTQRLEQLVQAVTTDSDGPDDVEDNLIDLIMASPEGHLAQVRDSRQRQVLPSSRAEPGAIPWDDTGVDSTFRTVEIGRRPYRVLVRDVSLIDRPYRILLASSLETHELVRERLAVSFLIAAPIALLLSSVGGLYIARRALKPVDQIAATASDITSRSLSRRIAVPGSRDALERLSRTFNDMLERLETSFARSEQFSADASHELRTPLAVIRTTAELALRHGATEEGYRADLKTIHGEAQSLSDLIDVLLTLSRKGVESQSVPMAEVDLAELAAGVCRQVQPQAQSKGIDLRLLTPRRPLVVTGNEPSLRGLTACLLENALAHTQAGRITVSVREAADEIHLSVADTGEGIPEEALHKVFDRFYRVDSSRSRTGGRLGLGLSIAQRIAELHDATLSARSRVGEGSTFTVRFLRHSKLTGSEG